MRIKFDSTPQATRYLSDNRYVRAEVYEERDLAIAHRLLESSLHSIWLRDGVIGDEAHVSIDGMVVFTVNVPIGDSAEKAAVILSKRGFRKLQDLERPLHSLWSDGEKSVTLDTDGWCDFDEVVSDLDESDARKRGVYSLK